MANLKKYISFTAQWIGDGTNSQVVLEFGVDPIQLTPVGGNVIAGSLSSLPSSISNVSASGASISGTPSYNSLTHKLTVNFTAAPGSNSVGSISGLAEYA